jgi:ketosteroid isomerase-like protein
MVELCRGDEGAYAAGGELGNMSVQRLFCLSALILFCCNPPEQNGGPEKVIEEIKVFMADYADMVRNGRFDEVANLYDERGTYFAGHGDEALFSFQSNKEYYMKREKVTIDFDWQETNIVPAGADDCLVVSKAYEHTAGSKDTVRYAYTALYTRTAKGWRIRHEHESKKCK